MSNIIHMAIGDFMSGLKTRLFVEGWEYQIQFDQYLALVNHKYSDAMSKLSVFLLFFSFSSKLIRPLDS